MSKTVNFFIKVDKEFLKVVDGYVVDPVSNKRTRLEFFYRSKSKKMVHLEFEDALDEIRYSLKHHVCRKKRRKSIIDRQPEYVSLFCKKLEILQNKVDEMCKQQNNKIIHDRESLAERLLNNTDNSSTNISTLSNTQNSCNENQRCDSKPWKDSSVHELPTEKQQPAKSFLNSSIHIETDELSQEEFVKNLGLTHTKYLQKNDSVTRRLRKSNVKAMNGAATNIDIKANENHPKLRYTKQDDFIPTNHSNKNETSPTSEQFLKPSMTLRQRKLQTNVSNIVKDKTPYSTQEDRIIIDWVLKSSHLNKVNGNSIWQDLEKKNIMPLGGRTWQSLRNRFLKTILSQLKDYGLRKEDVHLIIQGAQKGILHKKKKTQVFNRNYGLVIKRGTKENEPKPAVLNIVPKKISPSRIVFKNYPKTKRSPFKKNVSVYSDSDELCDDNVVKSFTKYKTELKNIQDAGNSRHTRSATKSKRKLFTMESFASLSQNVSSK